MTKKKEEEEERVREEENFISCTSAVEGKNRDLAGLLLLLLDLGSLLPLLCSNFASLSRPPHPVLVCVCVSVSLLLIYDDGATGGRTRLIGA